MSLLLSKVATGLYIVKLRLKILEACCMCACKNKVIYLLRERERFLYKPNTFLEDHKSCIDRGEYSFPSK